MFYNNKLPPFWKPAELEPLNKCKQMQIEK